MSAENRIGKTEIPFKPTCVPRPLRSALFAVALFLATAQAAHADGINITDYTQCGVIKSDDGKVHRPTHVFFVRRIELPNGRVKFLTYDLQIKQGFCGVPIINK